ncbi:MAG TPA: hypothetical protein PLD03_13435 [Thiomonas arsenitoxydans]|jgi:hypothetical protein|nr:MAG: hypothetical protein B7X43_00185 [Thiomonas sp. 15-63-373]HOI67593.1 hypothetical protein [Thiomonas arsenitoxydans]
MMVKKSTPLDRLKAAADLTQQLKAKRTGASALCDTFVRAHIDDIRELRSRGISIARYARLIAPGLEVRPAVLEAAIHRALPEQIAQQTPAPAEQPAKPTSETTQLGARSDAPSRATPPERGAADASRPAAPRSLRGPKAKPVPAGKPVQHSKFANTILPDWADYSDQRFDESDDDYIFRKALEMPPETQAKFIGEHDRHA